MKKHYLTLLAFCLLFNAAAPAALRAGEEEASAAVELISEKVEPVVFSETGSWPGQPEDQRIAVPAALIIMAGAKVWSVIVNGRPTAQMATAYASAIPAFSFNWDDLTGWKKVTRQYRYSVDSALQGRAVDIFYEVSFCYGEIPGEDGGLKGSYIANFTVKPSKIDLKWGWKVSLDAAMSDPMNIGTKAHPVAWLNSDLKWRVSGPLKRPVITVNSMTVTGTGSFTDPGAQAVAMPPVPMEEVRVPEVSWY